MRHTWRWFGPRDRVTIDHVMQAGAHGVVSALHDVADGQVWSADRIAQRQREIARRQDGSASNLRWEVVESLPVSESIKKQDGQWRRHIEHYNTSLSNLHAAGIRVVCYNFMPVLDWTRTDLKWLLSHGGRCMRFDLADFAVFDRHLLKRAGAEADYDEGTLAVAQKRYAGSGAAWRQRLVNAILCGLPGAAQTPDLDDVRALLQQYRHIDAGRLRRHHYDFLELVAPHAQSLGMRLCCHPDDPPFDLLGLPRVMSTEGDYRQLIDAVDLPANGITLCSGALGVRADNDLPGMMERLGHRVHFLHLRNVVREPREAQIESGRGDAAAGSFYESEHLAGDVDMVSLIGAVLQQERRRKAEGRPDAEIPMRPDHGLDILDDLQRDAQPGYPSIGRLRGLAELRGVERALTQIA